MSYPHSIYRKSAVKNPTKGVGIVVTMSIARENGRIIETSKLGIKISQDQLSDPGMRTYL